MMKRSFNDEMKRIEIERAEGWHEITFKMPFIPFKLGWQVAVTPPFGGATARFRVKTDGMTPGMAVSVYADHGDRLGCYGQPYWEVYPFEGDVGRCDIKDTDELVSMIEASLKEITTLTTN